MCPAGLWEDRLSGQFSGGQRALTQGLTFWAGRRVCLFDGPGSLAWFPDSGWHSFFFS